MNSPRRIFLWLFTVSTVMAPVQAATLWLEPDTLAPRAGQPVQVRLMLGDRFSGEERAIDSDAVVAFQRLRKNARKNLEREDGTRPAASYTTGDDGVEIVTLTWKGRTGSYYCKSIQVVGDARPGHPLRYSELGQKLEIVPQTDPVTLAREGGKLEVQVLYDREPLAGVRLLAMPKASPIDDAVGAVTDEIGIASFDLSRGGAWLIEVNFRSGDDRSYATLVIGAGER